HITPGSSFDKSAYIKGVEIINAMKADLVVCTGDITSTGLRKDYELAKTLLPEIKNQVYYTIGNHDARNVGYKLFEAYFGKRKCYYEKDNFVLYMYDSTIPDLDNGRIGRLSIKELKEELKKAPEDKIKIVAFHHHLLPVPETGRERNILLDGGDVLEAILDCNVDIVLNGHRHMPNVYQIENTIVSNAGGFSCEKVRAGSEHSFNSLYIYPNGKTKVLIHYIESGKYMGIFKEKKSSIPPADFGLGPGGFNPHSAIPNPQSGSPYLRIVHISDTHFTTLYDFREDIFDKGVQQINKLNPDLVVHTGDVTHDGLPEDFDLAMQKIDSINAPVLMLPGSHDLLHLGQFMFKEYSDTFLKTKHKTKHINKESSMALQVNDVDIDYNEFIKVIDNNVFGLVAINTAVFDDPSGLVGRRNLSLVQDELKKIPKEKIKIVAFHHHILPVPRTREGHIIEDAGNVLKTLVDSDVDIILTGHRHTFNCTQIENSIVVNANTFSSRRGLQKCRNSFNIIDVTQNRIVIIKEKCISSNTEKIHGVYRLGG
ncbi:MAG: metallophosphoesterase family protein, partial [Methanosarcinales archaeon]